MVKKDSKQIVIRNDREQFIEKTRILDAARDQLKTEFVGLDDIIDEIVRQVSFWFIFPELQEQPYIINLWGMTGVGKTALITRLIDLIGCSNRYSRFDLGQYGAWSICSDDLTKLAGFDRKIIVLDEFQHARTVDERGFEVKAYGDRIIWDLLDSGIIKKLCLDRGFILIRDFYDKLVRLTTMGLKARMGKVVAGKKLFIQEMGLENYVRNNQNGNGKQQDVYLIPDRDLDFFIERNFNGHNFKLNLEVRKFFNGLDEKQTIAELERFIESDSSQEKIKLTNMLIFVMGNIDEAYTTSNDFNAEIDADVFHRNSLNITIHKIKHALKKRFRAEQIARLGNNHVIYPSMSKQSFQKLIELELKKISGRFCQEKSIQLEFDNNIKDLIYQEGVVPTQGARPIISSVNQLVKANLGRIYSEVCMAEEPVSRILITAQNRQIVAVYHTTARELFSQQIPTMLFNIEKKQLLPDEKQAVTALHEAGHAIVGTILKGILPKQIYSRSSTPGADGFTLFEGTNRDVSSFSAVKAEVVCDLAGLAAEKFIFGSKNATEGAGSDIAAATLKFSEAILDAGMTSDMAHYNLNFQLVGVIHDVGEMEQKVRVHLKRAYRVARRIIKNEKRLLLELANYLSEHASMNSTLFNDYFCRFATPANLARFQQQKTAYRDNLQQALTEARNEDSRPEKKLVLIKTRPEKATAA